MVSVLVRIVHREGAAETHDSLVLDLPEPPTTRAALVDLMRMIELDHPQLVGVMVAGWDVLPEPPSNDCELRYFMTFLVQGVDGPLETIGCDYEASWPILSTSVVRAAEDAFTRIHGYLFVRLVACKPLFG